MGRALSPALISRVLCDALAGLHYAHERADYDGLPLGVVHRDVSPQNVFVTYDGQVKIVDSGVAHAVPRLTDHAPGVDPARAHLRSRPRPRPRRALPHRRRPPRRGAISEAPPSVETPPPATLESRLAPADNPFDGKLMKDGALHRVQAEAPGFSAQSRLLVFDRDQSLDLALQPRPRAVEPPGMKPDPYR